MVTWDLVKQGFIRLSAIGRRNRIQDKNFWATVDGIQQQIKDRNGDAGWALERHCLSLLDVGLIDELEKKNASQEGQEILIPLQKQLLTLAAVVIPGLTDPSWYNPVDTVNFLKGRANQQQMNVASIVKTIHECSFGEKEARDIRLAIMEFLKARVGQPASDWSEVIIRLVALDAVYQRFTRLILEHQKLLLGSYFYQAIALGVPVRQYFQTALEAASGIIPYFNLNKTMLEMIEANNEQVPLDGSGQKFQLAVIMKGFIANAQDKALVKLEQEKFAAAKVTGPEVATLLESLGIYAQLKEAVLINWLGSHQMGRDEQYQIDLLQLVFSFGLHGELVFIKEYYKNKETLVPVPAFLDRLKLTVHLDDETEIRALLHLADFLHASQFLAAGKELVAYDERNQRFEWQPLE